MRLSVKSDIDKVAKHLTYLERKQIPFAASVAINKTAVKVKAGLDGSTKQYMDRPNPFSQKPTAYTRSTKRNLVATVFVKPKQLSYLRYIIDGKSQGNRYVPVAGKTNAYGNLPKTYIKTRKAKGNFFMGKPGGSGKHSGLWEVAGRGKKKTLKLHAVHKDSIKHRKVWPFKKIARRIVRRHFAKEMESALEYALKTAR